jgi:hypothetical protein
MYEPYPGSTQLPETPRPPVPASVRNAASQLSSARHVLVVAFAISKVDALVPAYFKATPA